MEKLIEKVLRFQENNISIEEISEQLQITPRTLIDLMDKHDYIMKNGVFTNKKSMNTSASKKSNKKSLKSETVHSNQTMTFTDIKKLEELYSWYLEVCDNKIFKH